MLTRALDSLLPDLDGWNTVVVARKDELGHVDECLAGRPDVDVVALDGTPNGQALTACRAARTLPQDEPVAVWCADTVILPGARPLAADGNWLTVAPLPGDQWSFADADENGHVRRTAEKRRISPWASVGLYGFTTARLFVAVVDAATARTEMFVAPLYNHVISAGLTVNLCPIGADRVAPFGTPAEMTASCARLGWSPPDELAGVNP